MDFRAQFTKLSERSLQRERNRLGLPVASSQSKAALVEQLAQHSESELEKYLIAKPRSWTARPQGLDTRDLERSGKSTPPRAGREVLHVAMPMDCSPPSKMPEERVSADQETRRGTDRSAHNAANVSPTTLNLAAAMRQRQAADRRKLQEAKAIAERERDEALAALHEANAKLSDIVAPSADLPRSQTSRRSALALLTARSGPSQESSATQVACTSSRASGLATTRVRPEPPPPPTADASLSLSSQPSEAKPAGLFSSRLENSDPTVRLRALQSATDLPVDSSELDSDLITTLVRTAEEDEDTGVRTAAKTALCQLSPDALVKMLRHEDTLVCVSAVTLLGQLVEAQPTALSALGLPLAAFDASIVSAVKIASNASLESTDADRTASAAIAVLLNLGQRDAEALAVHARHVVIAMQSSSRVVRKTAVETLGKLPQRSSWSTLDENAWRVVRILDSDPDALVRLEAAKTLGKLGSAAPHSLAKASAEVLVRRLQDDTRKVRIAAVHALRRLDVAALETESGSIVATLVHPEAEVRLAALEALSRLESKTLAGYAPTLARLANRDADSLVRYRSNELLQRAQVEDLIMEALAEGQLGPRSPPHKSPEASIRSGSGGAKTSKSPLELQAVVEDNPARAWTSRLPLQTFRDLQVSLPAQTSRGIADIELEAARLARQLSFNVVDRAEWSSGSGVRTL